MDTMKAKEDLSHAISARKVMNVQQIRKLNLKRDVREDTMLLLLVSLLVWSAQLAQNALIQPLSQFLVKWENMHQILIQVE